MNKVIVIGELSLTIMNDEKSFPIGQMVGGRMANTATILSEDGLDVIFASEAAQDRVGDLLVEFLENSKVDIKAIDRFTEGRSLLNLIYPSVDGEVENIRYGTYPDEEGFNIVWPKVEEDDVVVLGGYYAVDPRVHSRLERFMNYVSEMKATVVYVPGFSSDREPRVTRVMPSILDNLEFADIIVTRNKDLQMIFGVGDSKECYNNHIDFYCRSLINVDEEAGKIEYFSGHEVSEAEVRNSESLLWQAGAVAGLVEGLIQGKIKKAMLDAPSEKDRELLLEHLLLRAHKVREAIDEPWKKLIKS